VAFYNNKYSKFIRNKQGQGKVKEFNYNCMQLKKGLNCSQLIHLRPGSGLTGQKILELYFAVRELNFFSVISEQAMLFTGWVSS